MTMFVHCECGATVSGETEDEIVSAVEAHIADAHPGMEPLTREQILGMAHEH